MNRELSHTRLSVPMLNLNVEGLSLTPSPTSSLTPATTTVTTETSFTSIHSFPPSVKAPYAAKDALGDIPGVSYALELFLASKMVESEDYCNESDPKKYVLFFRALEV
jgi:hypothetical protein